MQSPETLYISYKNTKLQNPKNHNSKFPKSGTENFHDTLLRMLVYCGSRLVTTLSFSLCEVSSLPSLFTVVISQRPTFWYHMKAKLQTIEN